jgi:hypothetical protein
MQFTEKRLRVKWYGGLDVACRAPTDSVHSAEDAMGAPESKYGTLGRAGRIP